MGHGAWGKKSQILFNPSVNQGSHEFYVGKCFSKPKNQGCLYSETLLFSKNLSNLDHPRNLNLIYLMKINL
jgi:hypothetical protein